MTYTQDWETPMAVTVDQLSDEVKKLVELESIYNEKKKVYKEADEAYEAQRTKLLSILMSSGQTKFHADGVGTISMAIKHQISVPKDPVGKKAMLKYFESLGPELFNSYVTVNHMTLNSYMNEQSQIDPDFTIPGCGEKKDTPELRFRKGK